jgi:hypothetical protein
MTQFENIKKMNIEEMAKFFSTDTYPDFPHSPCYVCEYDEGMCCAKPDSCTVEYKVEMYKKWLSQETNT